MSRYRGSGRNRGFLRDDLTPSTVMTLNEVEPEEETIILISLQFFERLDLDIGVWVSDFQRSSAVFFFVGCYCRLGNNFSVISAAGFVLNLSAILIIETKVEN